MTVLSLLPRAEFGLDVVAGVPEPRDTGLVFLAGVGSVEPRPMVLGVPDAALSMASGVPEIALIPSGVPEIALKMLALGVVLDCALLVMPAISSSSSS